MAYEWSSDLETGHPLIDGQHKALFEAVNRFSAAVRNGEGEAAIEKTLRFLVAYTNQHFRDEEGIQLRYNFPEYERHRYQHLEFSRVVQGLMERFESEGPTEALLQEIYVSAGDWLLHHIKSDDFVLAAFVREHE